MKLSGNNYYLKKNNFIEFGDVRNSLFAEFGDIGPNYCPFCKKAKRKV